MSDFTLYLTLGLEHIADLQAYDHMLFIISLCAIFQLKDWRKLLLLVTAFTIGHSITLALAVLDLLIVDQDLVEKLIPITIIITCLSNVILALRKSVQTNVWLHYSFALFFGLIHGLGFANYLKSLLMGMVNLTIPLFSFNLGIEIGQLLIVAGYFLLYFFLTKVISIQHRNWVITVSAIIALISLNLVLN
ncbi:HupE/UreJ family protein [Portibacter marinus]|uniref:HupE/UreJ family protein n=1 Tax=Portibacter marinus TaxID=2898660 RepID=UPI001F1FC9A0|nr:HupE/UreJ family protein [Portibacter marinus]